MHHLNASTRPRGFFRVTVLASIGFAATLLLAGCSTAGTGSGPAPTIATLESAGATGASTSAPVGVLAQYGTPPRERLDDSTADSARKLKPFNRCMADHGAARKPNSDASLQKFNAAQQICEPVYPKPPWQYDRSNPNALAFVQREITCLHTKGVKEVAIAPDDGSGRLVLSFGDGGDSSSISLGLQYAPACEATASATK